MTLVEMLALLLQILFVVLGFLTVKDYILYKNGTRRDIALMFSALALTYVIPILASVVGIPATFSGPLSSIALTSQPYLLLRLVRYFHPVSKRTNQIGLIGLFVSWFSVTISPLLSTDVRTILGVVVIGYFAAYNIYGMITLIRHAISASGVVKQRLRFAAIGSGLLGTALIGLAFAVLVPLLSEFFTVMVGVLAIGAGLCYYIGFSPPRALRRVWQLTEFRDFLLRLSSKPIGDRLNIDETVTELCRTANLGVGGFVAAVVQRDETRSGWLLRHVSDPSISLAIPSDNAIFMQVWNDRKPRFIRASDQMDKNLHLLLVNSGADTLLVSPIATTQHNWGLLFVFLKHSSLFVQDDLDLIRLLAQESAMFLENGALVDELHQYSDQLEQRVSERTLALEESQKEYRRIIEIAQEGIWTVDAANKTTFVNAKMAEMLGYTVAELMTLPRSELMDQDGENMVTTKSEERRQGITDQYEFRLRRKDGRALDVLVSSTPLLDEQGQYIGALAMIADITVRKQAEAEVQKLNAELEQRVAERTAQLTAVNGELEAFSYSVSHDLRAPLRALNGFSQALQEDYAQVLDEDGQDFLKRIQAGSQRMGQLIDDLLTLSQLTRSEMRNEQLDLSEIVQQVMVELCERQPDHPVEYVVQPDLMVQGDSRLLRLVCVNLLSNAMKFSSKIPNPRIEFGMVLQKGTPVYFIRDNGAGFDMAYANKLFGAFQRLHKATEFDGTGIGLATVQRVIHRHGGRVWAEGALNEGATFYFSLLANAAVRES